MPMQAWLSLALLFSAWEARAERPLPAPVSPLEQAPPPMPGDVRWRVDRLVEALVDPSAGDVKLRLRWDDLADSINGAKVVVRAEFKPWQKPKDLRSSPADADRLVASMRRRLWGSPAPPTPEVSRIVAKVEALHGDGRLGIDGSGRLKPNQMGVYVYRKGEGPGRGRAWLNALLAAMAPFVEDDFLASVAGHELAGHGDDPGLDSDHTVAAEVHAHRKQWAWLKHIDPRGDRIVMTVNAIMRAFERQPSELARHALNFAMTLNALYGTGGEPEKLRRFVEQIGYQDGHEHRAEASPDSA